jgi:Protein of unknown function (DUF3617)
MRRMRILITLGCSFLAMSTLALAQGRKPGLWEITTTTTMQQSPFPPGMANGPQGAAANPLFGGAPRTMQVCLTQAQIDKYGAPIPEMHGNCQLNNLVKKSDSMSAEMVCTGSMNGKANLESTWPDSEHAKGKVHFSGTIQAGPNPRPIEFTAESTSVFKGADCGTVKPMATPAGK